MTERRSSKPSEYIVGYGRPPKASQFAAGASGNPRGRPKGPRSVAAVLREILQKKVAVTENGRTHRIATLEVIMRRLANDAMRSDPRAVKLLISLVDRYAESSQAEVRLDELTNEDQAILAQYLREPADLAPALAGESNDRAHGDGV